MTKDCLHCSTPIEQVEGKRARLYCNATCKARYFQKTKALEAMITISRVEYDRLLAVYKLFMDQSLFLEGIIPKNNINEEEQAILDNFKCTGGNTKQKRLSGKDEAILKPDGIIPIDVSTVGIRLHGKPDKIPPPGLSKSDLAKWRKNNG